jgi:hypothetical protein
MSTAIITAAIVAALIAIPVAVHLIPALRDRLHGRRDAKVQRLLAPLAAPVEHIEADEQYADELAAARQDAGSPELIPAAEQMLIDHVALDGVAAAVGQFDRRMLHALRLFCGDDLELFMRLTRYDAGTLADTGQMSKDDVAALDALLNAEMVGVS